MDDNEYEYEEDLDYPFVAETGGVTVRVCPMYLEDESDEDDNRYMWLYVVQIENNSGVPLKLHTRQWKIVDAHGHVKEVNGTGVVGETPLMESGEIFEYESTASLTTSSGFMGGSYEMSRPDGSRVKIIIPTFALDMPGEIHSLN
ncbi:MAG: Co2+/Mg2+ efflux protein ApaG [Alphaproteobacteria bacterium]